MNGCYQAGLIPRYVDGVNFMTDDLPCRALRRLSAVVDVDPDREYPPPVVELPDGTQKHIPLLPALLTVISLVDDLLLAEHGGIRRSTEVAVVGGEHAGKDGTVVDVLWLRDDERRVEVVPPRAYLVRLNDGDGVRIEADYLQTR
jgi:hypothetical protein